LMTISEPTVARLLETAIVVQQIPAPTFGELQRARHVQAAFAEAGLRDVAMDDLHNVYGRIPGRSNNDGACLLMTAHLDTVFPRGTDLSVRRTPSQIAGPGIGDNSLAVAALIELPRLLREAGLTLARDLWLVANVGEEGQGDLRGSREVMRRFGRSPAAWIVLEGGFLGRVCYRGVGSRRYRISVRTEGGHSWFDFGRPNAIHVLVDLAQQLTALRVPVHPKTTFNIGVFQGGVSVNTIAETAHLELDLRSDAPHALGELVAQVERIRDTFAPQDAAVNWEIIGQRPAGGLSPQHPLVVSALAALSEAGFDADEIDTSPASTDANTPLSAGCPAVCIGLARGHHLHRLDEYIETEGLAMGMAQLLSLLQKLQAPNWETMCPAT
ncbi:MAG: M20/M25/M40 family metallo-hydrolase, partial [Novipirellula sp. JB048]